VQYKLFCARFLSWHGGQGRAGGAGMRSPGLLAVMLL
jgi:hypothetical protein